MNLVYSIDQCWLSENANSVFQLEEVERGFANAPGWAAWNAFLVWHHPSIEFYELFRCSSSMP